MLKTLFTLIFIGSVGGVLGQKLYSISYEDENEVGYECFMVYFNPNNCYMRVKYKANDSVTNVMHVEYRSQTGVTKAGENYLCLKADLQTRLVKGDSVSADYFIPNSFLWFTNAKSSKRGPWLTKDTIDFTLNGKVTSYLRLKPNLTESDLLEFYEPTEGDFEDLKAMCGIASDSERFTPPILKIKPTLHFIMAANTIAKGIGPSCKTDLDHLNDELQSIATTLGINYKTYLVTAKDISRTNLIKRINEVQPGTDDIVFFSYSGHGSRWSDQTDTFPFMNLWVEPPFKNEAADSAAFKKIQQSIYDNSMSISEVWDMITKKKARLNIVLGDLCNNSIMAPRPVTSESFEMNLDRGFQDAFTIRDPKKLSKLFLETKGNMISVATKPTEKAGCNPTTGGYFTAGFIDALEHGTSYLSDPYTWDGVLTETLRNALNYKRNSGKKSPQTGIRFINPPLLSHQ